MRQLSHRVFKLAFLLLILVGCNDHSIIEGLDTPGANKTCVMRFEIEAVPDNVYLTVSSDLKLATDPTQGKAIWEFIPAPDTTAYYIHEPDKKKYLVIIDGNLTVSDKNSEGAKWQLRFSMNALKNISTGSYVVYQNKKFEVYQADNFEKRLKYRTWDIKAEYTTNTSNVVFWIDEKDQKYLPIYVDIAMTHTYIPYISNLDEASRALYWPCIPAGNTRVGLTSLALPTSSCQYDYRAYSGTKVWTGKVSGVGKCTAIKLEGGK